ncbi:MAG TPA: hypothetical protein VHM89_13130 [Acidimicrobiales bacterium]|nr:hypothetical protein [Acidimicrobiales bacterium]
MTTTAVSVRAVRRVVVVVCVAGVAGMIVASVNDNSGAALTFGLVTTASVVCLVVATAVTRPAGLAGPGGPGSGAPDAVPGAAPVDDDVAARVEDLVGLLVASGADERTVRSLVREAVRLGRSSS